MTRPGLSYGLNLPNKKNQGPSIPKPGTTGQKRKKTIFDSDSEDEETPQNPVQAQSEEITTLGGLSPPSPKPQSDGPPAKKPNNNTTASRKPPDGGGNTVAQNKNTYVNLSSLHSSKRHAQTAESLDPSIYDYDGVYDSLHAKPTSSSTTSSSDPSAPQVPKYMNNLLRSAEVRKRDQLRARDKLLAKEREAEGEEFADKERFVTGAYKAQQEEVRRMEAEEAEREREEEEKRRKGGGMNAFYKQVLERDERKHEEVVRAAEERAKMGKTREEEDKEREEEEKKEKSEAQVAAELNAKGAHIVVNDEGQVVDKRQLLSAGLNVAPKPKTKTTPTPAASSRASTESFRRGPDVSGGRAGQRARQTEMLAAQLEERMRKEQEEEDTKQREIAEKNKSLKTSEQVQSARERYLARKREKEMAGK